MADYQTQDQPSSVCSILEGGLNQKRKAFQGPTRHLIHFVYCEWDCYKVVFKNSSEESWTIRLGIYLPAQFLLISAISGSLPEKGGHRW